MKRRGGTYNKIHLTNRSYLKMSLSIKMSMVLDYNNELYNFEKKIIRPKKSNRTKYNEREI